MSDTIWSNNGKTTMGNGTMQYKAVLDLIEPEVAKMLSYNDPMGTVGSDLVSSRLSLNDGSDIDGQNPFGLKPGALSAVTAPVGGYAPSSPNQGKRLGLGTASISGGMANRHPPDSFLQKFAGVGEATRDIELTTNGFGNLDLDGRSRRTSFNQQDRKGFEPAGYSSPNGSLNESLNINRTSRHQSISDKIDHYNSTSPIQAGATLNVGADLSAKSEESSKIVPPSNIWNPAAAAPFNPNYGPPPTNEFGGLYQSLNPYSRNMNPISPPPFMMASPPINFMDPRMYNMVYPVGNYPNNSSGNSSNDDDETPEKESEEPTSTSKQSPRKDYVHTPGIGMPRQANPGFMFQPFNGYPIYQSPPLMNMPLTGEEGEAAKAKPSKIEDQSPSSAPVNGASGSRKKNGASAKSNGPRSAPHIYRSPLLEEVRSNSKGKEYYLKDIYGHAIEFTKDQHGSRFIQQKLPLASDEEREVIFNEIRVISYELMTDVFGNYVIQKYFEHGTRTQKYVLLESMLGHVYELSLQMYGCRVVQRALEAIELDGQIKITNELRDHVLICAKDQNGNHVIQKSIERIPFNHVRFILESLENQIYHLSTHPYGCRVIQRLLEHSDEADQQKILDELNRFIFYLIQDQYGNYVMQHILERGKKVDREAILKIVLGSVVNFSKHKFASNVIEKCIKFGSNEQRKKILHEVLLGNEDLSIEDVADESPLALMMKDQYANYVIQKLVEAFDTKSQEKRLLVLKLRQYLKQISSKNSYGKHLASVEKMIVVAETALIEADNN